MGNECISNNNIFFVEVDTIVFNIVCWNLSHSSIEELLDDGYSPEEILKQAMPFEIDIVNNTPVDFFCRCSLEKFMDNLLVLGKTEIESMKNEQQYELICKYCNSKYYLSEEDFAIMLSTF